jgi:hypothetical protein
VFDHHFADSGWDMVCAWNRHYSIWMRVFPLGLTMLNCSTLVHCLGWRFILSKQSLWCWPKTSCGYWKLSCMPIICSFFSVLVSFGDPILAPKVSSNM